ncbi:hypothetical protein L596_029184 [Steinernema carpocapsae]|uniref:Uncharacterized protein n=1 Tax=Steinernema carpocapsae TaxID=34508 RepID=A0A4V5ZXE5_STECR|nr:hypothetical protein L596_029184 [Steinernema carpocapsae]
MAFLVCTSSNYPSALLSPTLISIFSTPNTKTSTMLCFEELNCATSDVFSYMCSLAMEKCSKKSEKKRAACGGAAMRKRLLIKNFVAHMLSQETEIRKKIETQQQRAAEERELEHVEDVYDVDKEDDEDEPEMDEFEESNRRYRLQHDDQDEDDEEEEEDEEDEEEDEDEVPILALDAEDDDVKRYEQCSTLYASADASLMDAVPVEELMKGESDLFDISAVGVEDGIIQIECAEWPDFQTVPTSNQHFLIPCDSREFVFPHHHYESYLSSSCEYEFALPDNILEDEPAVPSDPKAPSPAPLFTNLVNITPQSCVDGVSVSAAAAKEVENHTISLYSFDDNPRKRGRGLLEQDENSMYSLIVPKRVKLL